MVLKLYIYHSLWFEHISFLSVPQYPPRAAVVQMSKAKFTEVNVLAYGYMSCHPIPKVTLLPCVAPLSTTLEESCSSCSSHFSIPGHQI